MEWVGEQGRLRCGRESVINRNWERLELIGVKWSAT